MRYFLLVLAGLLFFLAGYTTAAIVHPHLSGSANSYDHNVVAWDCGPGWDFGANPGPFNETEC